MERSLVTRITSYLSDQKRRKIGYWILVSLGAIVVFITTYILILPAVTLSNEPICGLEEHQHDESCLVPGERQLVCEDWAEADLVVHTHSKLCYNSEKKLTCPLAEYKLHVHDSSCYVEMQTMVCGHEDEEIAEPEMILVPGHTHTEKCYTRQRGDLTCTQEEMQGHAHSDSCYTVVDEETGETELTCGQDEAAGHTHGNSCYDWEEVLTCGQEESEDTWIEDPNASVTTVSGHVHTDDCYAIEKEQICFEEELTLHTHTKRCYDLAADASELEGLDEDEMREYVGEDAEGGPVYDKDGALLGWGVMTCDKPVIIEHKHSDSCLSKEENLVLGCGLKEHEHGDDCYIPLGPDPDPHRCGLSEHTHDESCYFESGELLCTIPEHTHTDECLDPDNFEKPKYDYGFDEDEATAGQLLDEDGDPVLDGNGNAVLVDDDGNLIQTDEDGNPVLDEDGNPALELDENGEPISKDDTVAFDDLTYKLEMEDFDVTLHITGLALLPEKSKDAPADDGEEEASEPSDDEDVPADDAPEADAPADEEPAADESGTDDPAADTQPAEADEDGEDASENVSSEDVEFRLETVDENEDEDAKAVQDQASETEVEQLMFQVMKLKAYVGGRELDLSKCEATLEVQPKLAYVERLVAEAMKLTPEEAAIADEDATEPEGDVAEPEESVAEPEEGESEEVLVISLYDTTGLLGAMEVPMSGTVVPDPIVVPLNATMTIGLDAKKTPNAKFTVQYWANIPVVDRGTSGTLPVIDTDSGKTDGSNGKLPANGSGISSSPNSNKLAYLTLTSDKTVKTTTKLTKIYSEDKFEYYAAPSLKFFNKVQENLNYVLKEVWILKSGKDPASTSRTDWNVTPYSENVHFTNRSSSASDGTYLLIQDGTVIRLVYEPVKNTYKNSVLFHDYDISLSVTYNTTAAGGTRQEYNITRNIKGVMKTANGGINATDIVNTNGTTTSGSTKGTPVQIAFGNANTGTNYKDKTWSKNGSNTLNIYNRNSYQGCTFGLAKSALGANDSIQFNVAAPQNLFGTTDIANAKKSYAGHQLQFSQIGDTYTLSTVIGSASVGNLEKFNNPATVKNKNGTTMTHTKIWTNNFWPMDIYQNKDLHFGYVDPNGNWKSEADGNKNWDSTHKDDGQFYNNSANNAATSNVVLPKSDDGLPHNSYFSMEFTVDFSLTQDYVGPLEYYFFGDDDMWVYLKYPDSSSKLVCDIGGVHSSVGEYINLWNWINQDTNNKGKAGDYQLVFFYTERGASGSTCWMQFTLPSVSSPYIKQETEALRVEKKVDGDKKLIDPDAKFEFTIELTDENGKGLMDDYNYSRYTADGKLIESDLILANFEGDNRFTLKGGEYIILEYLPPNTLWTITEDSYDGYQTRVVVDSGKTQSGCVVTGQVGKDRNVVFTNHVGYKLPHTGGTEALLYTTGVTILFLAACGLLYSKKQRRKGGCQ